MYDICDIFQGGIESTVLENVGDYNYLQIVYMWYD